MKPEFTKKIYDRKTYLLKTKVNFSWICFILFTKILIFSRHFKKKIIVPKSTWKELELTVYIHSSQYKITDINIQDFIIVYLKILSNNKLYI